MSASVRFDDVSLDLGGRVVLDGLNLLVPAGETLVLLGRSGSGKTSALRLVNAMLTPTFGKVSVDDKPVNAWDLIRLRRSIGYAVQDVGLLPHMTVDQNIGLLPRLEGWAPEKIRSRVRELLQAVGLPPEEFAARYPRELSGGQRQRAGIARALALDPAVLLFDEPFTALDPVIRRELQDQFIALRDTLRKTSIFVTHDVNEALRVGTYVAVLAAGKLELLTTPGAFRREVSGEAAAFLRALDN